MLGCDKISSWGLLGCDKISRWPLDSPAWSSWPFGNLNLKEINIYIIKPFIVFLKPLKIGLSGIFFRWKYSKFCVDYEYAVYFSSTLKLCPVQSRVIITVYL